MKKALVLGLILLFGVGIAATAQLSGYWSSSITIDPSPVTFDKFFTALDSTLKVDYALSNWTFGGVSSFDITGFSAQTFSASGALGAFTFATSMSFDPAYVTTKTYAIQTPTFIGGPTQTNSINNLCPRTWASTTSTPEFTKWDVTASVSIAGVSFEAYVLQDYANTDVTLANYLYLPSGLTAYTQTDSVSYTSYNNGMGWRLKVGGSFGAVNVTSYTYFNISELGAKTTYGLTIAKRGTYSIAVAGCAFLFNEQYVLIEGFTFGCATIDIGLKITCAGFSDITFLVKDVSLGGWANFDFQIKFTESTKAVTTNLAFVTPAFACVELEVGFGSGAVGYAITGKVIDSLYIHGLKFEATWNGITFTSVTEFDAASLLMSTSTAYAYLNGDTEVGFLVPFTGIKTAAVEWDCEEPSVACADAVYWALDEAFEVKCIATERFRLWEKFTIDVDADGCCGGLFDLTVTTYFGEHQVLDYYGYATYAKATAYAAGKYSTLVSLYGTVPTTSTSLTAVKATTYKYGTGVKVISDYKAGTTTTLFDWAKTTATLSVGVSETITLNLGFNISAFGWESFTAGYKWEF